MDVVVDLPADRATRLAPTWVSTWLFAVAGLVVVMIAVGGATRLTRSGLSIVEWEPIRGVVPPLSAADWAEEFDAYKAHPEYQLVNDGMSLAEFQRIYAWEYLHRLLGRVIGVAFLLPFVVLLARRALDRRDAARIGGLVALLGLQGAIGWWMVRSGLVDRPDVAHERLAVHLVAALVLLVGLLWVALDLRDRGRPPPASPLPTGWIAPFWIALGLQVVLGAFVAGLSAGRFANTWPTVDGRWIPSDLGRLDPWWSNLVDDPLTVQFVHRWMAMVLAVVVLLAARALHRRGARGLANGLTAAVLVQVVLGVLTLLHAVPVLLGVLHQLGAVALVIAGVVATHEVSRSVGQPADGSVT